MIESLFASGRAVDLILMVMVVEGGWLVTRRGRRAGDVLFMLLPGALMMLALRGALTGSDWTMIAIWLLLSFPAHLEDVRRRGRV